MYNVLYNMVEVFKTNIAEAEQAQEIVSALQQYFPDSRVTIDLDDCDKVLRLEGQVIVTERVINLLQEHNYECCMLQ